MGWAVAAAAALAMGVPAALESPPASPSLVVRDLASLEDGEVVEAVGGPLAFGTAGRVTWTLAEGGRLVVQDDIAGSQHVVALERGSIHAQVTPRLVTDGEVIETFAVEVGETRVAVRGTVFSVTRAGPGLIVDVEEGAVAVGKLGSSGLTEGSLVLASERASFSLDGGKDARRLARSSRSRAAAGSGDSPVLAESGSAVAEPGPDSLRADASGARAGAPPSVGSKDAPPPAKPAPPISSSPVAAAPPEGNPSHVGAAAPSLTVEQLRAGLIGCFAQVYEGHGATIQLSVSTVFHLSVEADGSIQSARFVPPLKPEMAECAGRLIAGRFDRGPQQLQIPIQFQTKRD